MSGIDVTPCAPIPPPGLPSGADGTEAVPPLYKTMLQKGPDCVIAWTPGESVGRRPVRVSAVRESMPDGPDGWKFSIELENRLVGRLFLPKHGRWYAVRICRALAKAVAAQANHQRRWRANKKARTEAAR